MFSKYPVQPQMLNVPISRCSIVGISGINVIAARGRTSDAVDVERGTYFERLFEVSKKPHEWGRG